VGKLVVESIEQALAATAMRASKSRPPLRPRSRSRALICPSYGALVSEMVKTQIEARFGFDRRRPEG
jgi:hypothetical protein